MSNGRKGPTGGPSSQPPTPPTVTPQARQQRLATQIQRQQQQRANRLTLLAAIAAERGAPVVAYVTGNRESLGTQIGGDIVRLLREHLGSIGKVPQLDVVLITNGGNVLTAFRLISLLREFASRVGVLIPYMAHSAGTLVALGADEIVMGAMAELSPVDPSVTNTFNPLVDALDVAGGHVQVPRVRIPISVEDVTSYLNLARERAGLGESGMATAFAQLTEKVHPLALGNILRNHTLIRQLVRRLLLTHMSQESDKATIDSIVEALTEKLYAHDYLIAREEARSMGLKVVKPADTLETALWNAYIAYETDLQLGQVVNFDQALGSNPAAYLVVDAGVLETQALTHVYSFGGVVHRAGGKVQFAADLSSWHRIP
jgi:hypothetical protein